MPVRSAKEIRYYVYLAGMLLCLFLTLPVLFSVFAPPYAYPVVTMKDGWYMERGETTAEEVSLSNAVTAPVRMGEAVLLSHALPEEEVPEGCVLVVTERAFLRAFVDGNQVYSYGEYEPGVMTPTETHYIRLPDDYAGKDLLLLIAATHNNAFHSIQPVHVGNQDDLASLLLHRRIYGALYGIFLTGYGLVLFVLSVYLLRYVRRNLRLLLSSFISLLGGLAVLGHNDFFTYVLYNPLRNAEIQLIALFFLPAAVTGLFVSLRTGIVRMVLSLMTAFNVFWALFTCVLYSSPDRFYPLSGHLSFFRRMVVAETLAAALLFAYEYYNAGRRGTDFFVRPDARRSPTAAITLFAGAGALALLSTADILFLRGFAGQRIEGIPGGGLSLPVIGLLFFDACVISNHYFFAAEHLGETSRNRKLNEIAYTDPLTGHSNRAHCELVMRELDETGTEFCMINMDVNGLKIINDTLGHAEGDRFLKGFAQILKIFFKNADLIGRMGGDEFLVILKNTALTDAQDRMEALTVLLHKMNRSESAFKYEASYGIAHSREIYIGKKSAEVYRLADERMYEMKREVHARRGGNGRD